MVSKITLTNFFSFGEETTIELNPDVNILVGINGSGKSNLLKAIRLLYDGVVGHGFEKTFLKEWGGFDNVAHFGRKDFKFIKLNFEFDKEAISKLFKPKKPLFDTNIEYEISIEKIGKLTYRLHEFIADVDYQRYEDSDEEYEHIYLSSGSEAVMIYGKDGSQVTLSPENKFLNFNSSELVLRQVSDPDSYPRLFLFKKALEKLSVYEYFDTTLRSPIRQANNFDTEGKLLYNGQNLTSVLQRMKNHHAFAYEELEGCIQKINPHFKDISFDFLGPKVFLVLREKGLSKAITAEYISDGTLRYLLLLSILLNPERGNIVCIDEPEIGLHPDMTNTIAEAIKKAGQDGTQLFIATHSPLLLNSFSIDEVLVFEKDENNQTRVNILEEEDLDEADGSSLIGQLWLKGKIGGKRW